MGAFFSGSLMIETIFSLDGLGGWASRPVKRDYPVMFGRCSSFGLIGLVVNIISDLMYVWIDPRIDFETREGCRMNAPASSNAQAYDAQGRPKGWLSPTNRRRWANFKANRRGYWSLWIFMILFIASLLAEFIANDRPILASYKGEILYPVLVDYPEEKFGGFLARTDYRDPFIQEEIEANGWMTLAADPLFLHHRELLHPAFRPDRGRSGCSQGEACSRPIHSRTRTPAARSAT
jgi:hypothetical protein